MGSWVDSLVHMAGGDWLSVLTVQIDQLPEPQRTHAETLFHKAEQQQLSRRDSWWNRSENEDDDDEDDDVATSDLVLPMQPVTIFLASQEASTHLETLSSF